MIHSYEIDLRILFKKFYCPKCGQKLIKKKVIQKLNEEQTKEYYKELFPLGVPINFDVGKVKRIFKCSKCHFWSTTDEQVKIYKIQKRRKKKILSIDEF